MEKKAKASELFRKIIREELTKVLRQELPRILNENKGTQKKQIAENFPKPTIKNHKPLVTREEYMRSMTHAQPSSPIASILQQTAMSMDPNDPILSGYAAQIPNEMLNEQTYEAYGVESESSSIGDMFQSARQSTIVENVQINSVPDFSEYMKKMGI